MVEVVGGIAIKESAHGPHFETYETYVAKMVKNWDSLPMYMVTMGPVCLIKLSQKQKMLWTLGFFLEFFSQLISTTGSWDSPPVYRVTHCDHGTSVSDKIVQKTKNVVNTRFFLRIFSPAYFNHWRLT